MTTAVQRTPEDLVGMILEQEGKRFQVDTFIGTGEKGTLVYRAHAIALPSSSTISAGAPVAARFPGIPEGLGGLAYEQAIDAFLAEAKALTRASETSEDVESLLAYGVAQPGHGLPRMPFCVFEWLEGKSLEQHIAEIRSSGMLPSIGEALTILEPAARGLAAVHALGVAHKDVRPRNLWLATVEGHRTRMKVTQFVLASRIGASDDAFSPHYAAPEHFKRSYGPVGPHTDVYGLALCLVELVSGKRALEGADATELFLATGDLSRRPTLRARGVQISDAVESVIARAVAVDPKRRWQNVRELWEALVSAVPELTPAVPSVRPSSPKDVGLTTSEAETSTPGGPGTLATPSAPPSKRAGSQPPPSLWSSREVSASIPPVEDKRLADSMKVGAFQAKPTSPDPSRSTRSSAIPWIVVAVFAIAAGVVVARRLLHAGVTPTSRVTPSALATSSPLVSASTAPPPSSPPASPSSSEEPALMLRPFLTDMIRISPGKFMMGTDKEGRPAHSVVLTKAFFIDRTEVTTEMYYACIDEGVCTPGRVHSGDAVETTWGCYTAKEQPKHPMNCVDRTQAEKFCTYAQKRLPTEAEWEYAARGKDGREYPWGNAQPTSCAQAIISGLNGDCRERKGPMEVGRTPEGRSAFGALDMAGNVWEWVADGFELYPTAEVTDPKVPINPQTNKGVLRGGSWDYSPLSARSTYRYAFQVNVGNISTGFRCARDATD